MLILHMRGGEVIPIRGEPEYLLDLKARIEAMKLKEGTNVIEIVSTGDVRMGIVTGRVQRMEYLP